MNVREIPLNKLVPSPRNMRQGDVFIDDLVANIAATRKVLQNLRVTPEQGEDGKPTGRFEVHVGGRRLRALNLLSQRKSIKPTFPVPCAICEDEAEALEESIAENNIRLPPHPADQFAAFHELSQTGKTVSEIAERFSISPRIVERRLKLATVSPRLMELFRADELSLDQMAVFTLTDDHAAQEAAYFDAPRHSRSPWEIKRRILGGAISTETNPLAKFVGLDAFRQAGGVVSQDLFAGEDDAGFITDIALLERLATERLEIEAEAIRGEGWAWVEVALSWDYSTSQQYGRAYPSPAPLTPEVREEIERLSDEYRTLEAESSEDDDACARMEEIDRRLSDLEGSASESYADEVKAITGAVVTLSHGGELRIERGCAKPGADTKALRALQGQDSGSRTSSAYPTQERPKRESGALADKLVLDLSAHRTAAIRASLLTRHDIALVAVTHALLVQAHYGCAVYDRPTTFELSADTLTNHPQRHCQGYQASKAGQALTSARGRMTMLLPTSSRELWAHLRERSQDQLLELLAYAAAQLVNGLVASHNQANTDRVRAADVLAEALGLNMADWWEANAESFFGRVSKPVMLAAIAEVSTVQAAENLAGLKKVDLAAEAEKRVAGKGWLPPLLRSAMARPAPGQTLRASEIEDEPESVVNEEADDEHPLAAE